MNFVVVGTNHKTSFIELRERLSFSKKRLKEALFFLQERSSLKAGVILSTCNRVEIYASTEEAKAGISEIEDFIFRYHEIDRQKPFPCLYIYQGSQAMRHLFSVTCGLDSLILGETQILQQVKFSLSESEGAEFVDEFLRGIFYTAISLAKQIHRETKISEGKVSTASVAIDFIKEKLDGLAGKNILIIGVGKVTKLVLKYFPPKADPPQAGKKEEPNVVFISNRTFKKAEELAASIGAKAVKFDELKDYLAQADGIISATASPHFILRKEVIEEYIDQRPTTNDQRLIILDLALPRDVDPRVKEIRNVELFSLEDLDSVIKKNMERKIQEAEKAKEIINTEVERLWSELTKLEPEPALLP